MELFSLNIDDLKNLAFKTGEITFGEDVIDTRIESGNIIGRESEKFPGFERVYELFKEEKNAAIGKSLLKRERMRIIERFFNNFDNNDPLHPRDQFFKADMETEEAFNEKYRKEINDLREYCKNYFESLLFHITLFENYFPQVERNIIIDNENIDNSILKEHVCLTPFSCKEIDEVGYHYEYELPGFDFKEAVKHINETFFNDVIYNISNHEDFIDEDNDLCGNFKNRKKTKYNMDIFTSDSLDIDIDLRISLDEEGGIDFSIDFKHDDAFVVDLNNYWGNNIGILTKNSLDEEALNLFRKNLQDDIAKMEKLKDFGYKIDDTFHEDSDWNSEEESDSEEVTEEKEENFVENCEEPLEEIEVESKESEILSIEPVEIYEESLEYHTTIIKSEFSKARAISYRITEEYFKIIDKQFFASYKFELDMFQKQACVAIANNENVFVAAHTSAGKTLIAEFACRYHNYDKQRVFYTSPIKALSNQKFNDFRKVFDNVGLVTGDTKINGKESSIVIVTTEILQSMLYNGAEDLHNLACVIFDEVHYINNSERGHVWEEVLIMLPKYVKVVMLSATVPNYVEFSDWVGRVLNDKVVCITTPTRPVQLQHQIYVEAFNKIEKNFHTIMVGDGSNINVMAYKNFCDSITTKDNKGNVNNKKSGASNKPYQVMNLGKKAANRVISNIYQPKGPNSLGSYDGTHKNLYSTLIRHLHFPKDDEPKTPMVVFVFSRKQCDNYVAMLHNVDLTTNEEKFHVANIFKDAKMHLEKENLDLPQLIFVEESCKRGIAMHHSGMLPFLKEVVEMVFAKGLVKVLFATETFAMGINMPTKTVVFDELQKFDSSVKRFLTPTEYTQMAGRAGRRGLDKAGHVIIIVKNKNLPNIDDLRRILVGKSVTLSSKFKITNLMVLNSFQKLSTKIDDFIKLSFAESDTLRFVENIDSQIMELNNMIEEVDKNKCNTCETGDVYSTTSLVETYSKLIKNRYNYNRIVIENCPSSQLGIGKVIIIDIPEYQLNHVVAIVYERYTSDLDIIVLANSKEGYDKIKEFNIGNIRLDKDNLSLHTLLTAAYHNGVEAVNEKYCILSVNSLRIMKNIPIKYVVSIIKYTFKSNEVKKIVKQLNGKDKAKDESSLRFLNTIILKLQQLCEKLTKHNYDKTLIQKPFVLKDFDFKDCSDIINDCKYQLENLKYPCFECKDGYKHYLNSVTRYFINDRLNMIRSKENIETLEVYEEYSNKVKALLKLGFLKMISGDIDTSQKGQGACIMGSFHILLTEMVYNALFRNKTPEYIVAMLAILASEGHRDFPKNTDLEEEEFEKPPDEEITEIRNKFKIVHDHVNQAFIEAQTQNYDYIECYSIDMMEIAYLWMKEVSLASIMKVYTVPEGNIVRILRKIWDLLDHMRKLALHMGDKNSAGIFDDIEKKMARGIVFSASLYTIGADKDEK
uniref:Helicase ATP-binding domain-containing protein n=1 Tax=Parastrongyloides trichosuri TaxID=131310 RepID=A0A0N4ZFC0_PARTI